MNDLLEQAITASRAGDRSEAHLLLASLIKKDPHNTEAWYQLSTLVDDPQQQLIFVRRALAIDAQHPRARVQLARLVAAEQPAPRPESIPSVPAAVEPPAISPDLTVSQTVDDFLTQAGGETAPEWLAEEEGTLVLPATDALSETIQVDLADLPDWLQEEPEPGWSEVAVIEASTPPSPVELKQETKPTGASIAKVSKPRSNDLTNWLLGGLVVAAVIIFLLFVIALINALL